MNEEKKRELDLYPHVRLRTKKGRAITFNVFTESYGISKSRGVHGIFSGGINQFTETEESPEEIEILIDRMNEINMRRKAEIEREANVEYLTALKNISRNIESIDERLMDIEGSVRP